MMTRLQDSERRGQALVEFALIIGVLFLIIFVVIESGHLLHANLTVQSAAREAGRYAITGQFDAGCLAASPPCDDPRVHSIKARAEEKLAGLSLNAAAGFEDPGYYLVEVFGTNAAGEWVADSAGMPGRPILVRVTYRANVWTPLLRPIAQTVMVSGQTIMNNERVVAAGSAGEVVVPPVPPPPGIEPTPQPAVDLVMAKTAPATAMENKSFRYRLTVHNAGERDAASITVGDPLHPSLSFISVDDDDCSHSAGAVTCHWGPLAVGQSRSVLITVAAREGSAGQTIHNTATVAYTGSGVERNTTNNSATAQTDIHAFTTETDLEIVKSGPASAPVSTDLQTFYATYRLTVYNHGPNDASNIEITDNLPPGVSFEPLGSSGNCSGGAVVSCTIYNLLNGESATLTIRAQTPRAPGALTNSASLTASNDNNSANNVSSVETEFIYLADLEITKTASAAIVNAGETLTYYLTVQNRPESPHTATGVTISDPLPPLVELQSADYSATGGSGACAVSGNVVTCSIGTLQPGESASATIEVVPLGPGAIVNSAQVAGEQNDPDVINSSTATTMVNAEADLSIVKTATPATLFAGDLLTYKLLVHNDGPSRATGVTVVDEMPPASHLVYQFAETERGSCNWEPVTRQVTCFLGTLPAGELATITITGVPIYPEAYEGDPLAQFTNRARVFGNEADPVDNNNSAITVSAREGDPFITVQPACGPAGTPMQIDGYLWSAQGNRAVMLGWVDPSGNVTNIASVDGSRINSQTGQFPQSLSFTVPVNAYKEDYAIRARQAAQENIGPAVEDTVLFQVPCPAPDLEVTEFVAQALEVAPAEPIEFTITIENSGNRDASAPFYVSLYAFQEPQAPDQTALPEANRLDVGLVNSLDSGASLQLTLRAHRGFADSGAHYVYALVDAEPGPAGSIVEMYENNNTAGLVVEVTEGADPPEPAPGTQQLSGETYIASGLAGVWQLQPFVTVNLYDAAGGAWLASTRSTATGAQYEFTDLPEATTYYVEAVITIDGVAYTFRGSISPPAATLFLTPEQGMP